MLQNYFMIKQFYFTIILILHGMAWKSLYALNQLKYLGKRQSKNII